MTMSDVQPVAVNSSPADPQARVRLGAIADAWRLILFDFWGWVIVSLMAVLLIAAFSIAVSLLLSADFWKVYHLKRLVLTLVGTIPLTLLLSGVMQRGLSQIRGALPPPVSIFYLGFSGREVARYAGYITMVSAAGELIILALHLHFLSFPFGPIFGESWLTELLVHIVFVGIQGVLVLGLPLVFDQGYSPREALSITVKTFKRHYLLVWGMALLWGICTALGLLACIVGILITFPLMVLTPAVIFDDFFPQSEADPVSMKNAAYPQSMQA